MAFGMWKHSHNNTPIYLPPAACKGRGDDVVGDNNGGEAVSSALCVPSSRELFIILASDFLKVQSSYPIAFSFLEKKVSSALFCNKAFTSFTV